MINIALYNALVQRFGSVKVSNQGQRRKAVRSAGDKRETVLQPGEAYNICCPFCGDDRYRCSVSHAWLCDGVDRRPRVDLINCYNEGCRELYKEDFYDQFIDACREGAKLQRIAEIVQPEVKVDPIRLPNGCVPIANLSQDHLAIAFLQRKYPHVSIQTLNDKYGVMYTEEDDDRFRLAPFRVIFPIYEGGKLISWQGRTINALDKVRWLLPPGFTKPVYNIESVGANNIPRLAEGITSAIGCGPDGVAIFGKQITPKQVKMLKKYRRVIVATDPETYVPDYLLLDRNPNLKPRTYALELKAALDAELPEKSILLEWPEEILAKARIKVGRDKEARKGVSVPDPADLGHDFMDGLVTKAMERALYV